MATDDREEELAARQDPRLYPVGRVLRDTFDAENHDSLGTDVTGLMLDLARIEVPAVAQPCAAAPPDRSWWGKVRGLWERS